ncbi:MAG: MBL fold metallo-hydrolase [Vicinamibacterales bacterium]
MTRAHVVSGHAVSGHVASGHVASGHAVFGHVASGFSRTILLSLLLLTGAVFAADRFGDVEITPFSHSHIQIEHAGKIIHIDPWSVSDLSKAKPADLILITDDVAHHLDVRAIARLRKPGATVVIAANGLKQVPDGIVMNNGDVKEFGATRVEAIGAYDIKPGDPYHPKGEANGYVITVGGKRIYVVGVTECVPEVRAAKNVDVAFFPVNLPQARMEPAAAIECIAAIAPKVVYPYHYDQEWVRPVPAGGVRPTPTTRGLQELKTALAPKGISVRFANWYPK